MAAKADNRMAVWMQEGHEPVRGRGTVRLYQFKKSLPKGLEVTVLDRDSGQYRPLMLSCGRPLLCSEVLPERADLALDEEGHLLSQADFEARYGEYLSAFPFPYGSEINSEPVPNVVAWVKETPDPYGESKGMIEIGFDPKLNEDFKPKARFGPNGETEEEWLKESQKNSNDVASALKVLAANQTALTEFLMRQAGETPVRVEEPPRVEPAPEPAMTAAEAASAVGASNDEVAPCGKKIRRGYLAQHQRFCNSDDCGGPGLNSSGEAA